MTWSGYLAGVVGLQYLAASSFDFYQGNLGYGLMWFAYALANVGIVLSMKGI